MAIRKTAYYANLVDGAVVDPDWTFAGATRKERSAYTHGFHRYPAKFIPQLVDKALEDYGPGNRAALIFDPFCGSGTTLVCGLLKGYFSAGADINPLATLITEVKARPIDPEKLNHRLKKVRGWVGRPSPSPIIPERHEELILRWFPQENIYRLGHLLGNIMTVDDPEIQMFLKVCFSHILKPASRWSNSSTKPVKDKEKRIGNAEELFLKHLDYMEAGMAAYWDALPSGLRAGHLGAYQTIPKSPWLTGWPQGRVDTIVTSPPYCTSYDYLSIHQLSIAWLDLSGTDSQAKAHYIGSNCRPNVTSTMKPNSSLARLIVRRLKDKHVHTSQAVSQYYLDMWETWLAMSHILKRGGHMVIVIGDTTLKGVKIQNAAVFCEMIEDLAAMELVRVFKREIPSKLLPSTRNPKTGRFSKARPGASQTYPTEMVLVARKS